MKVKRIAMLLGISIMLLAIVGAGCSSGASSPDQKSLSGPDNSTSYALIEEGKLTIAASLDFPPLESLENNEPVGFSIELMGLLAEELGLECEYLPSVSFEAIAPMIVAGDKADVGVSSFSISEERKKEVDFTQPYCESNLSIVVMKGSGYSTVDDLEGKTVGAQSGTTGYDWATANIIDAEVHVFDGTTAAFEALKDEQIDALVIDHLVAEYFIKEDFSNAKVIQEIPTNEQYGIIVNKNNPELTEALDKALEAIKANGKYDELYQKWFG